MFTPRLSKPSLDDKHYISNKKGGYNTCIVMDETNGNTLPNCVGYAHGRISELLGNTKVDWSIPACNAEDWIEKAVEKGYQIGNIPKLGAVLCWGVGKLKNGGDGAGHVAVVEQINADGSIVTSESGYKSSKYFWTKTRKNDGNWQQSKSYNFRGFIYFGEFDENADIEYKVVRGDTLWSISRRFLGLGARYTELMKYNCLNSSKIKVGQIIRIPRKE